MHRAIQAAPMAVSMLAATSAAVSSTGDPGVDFAQYGLVGVVTSVLVWFIKSAYERERDRADRLDEEVVRLRDIVARLPQTPVSDHASPAG